jgi:broad specificity phosphatase PhoE
MSIVRALVAALLIVAPASAQEAVFLVRHAEKASNATDAPLSDAGERRAEALARHLKDARVAAIYTTEYQRTIRTGEPLARAIGLRVISMTGGPDAFVSRIRAEHPREVALVVGHSNTLPDLIKAFGASDTITIADDEYDNLFVLVPTVDGSPLLLRLRY